ncbi:MAG: penicillin-binding transpeptidase domain-containing protein [Cellulosilyticaceae bacterium]
MKKTTKKSQTQMRQKKKNADVKESFAKRKKRLNSRLLWVRTGFVLFLTFLLCRVGYFKIVKGEEFEKAVLSRMTSTEREVQALRGGIVDRNNKTIATSTLSYHIILDPVGLLDPSIKEEKRQNTYKVLAEYMKKSPADIEKLVKDNATSRYKVVKKDISAEDMEKLGKITGVWYQESFIRQYPKETFASQLVGFYNQTAGQYGVEQYYNETMTGKPGRIFPKLQDGNIVTTEVSAPVNGNTLVLTIDEVIQQYVEQVMDQYVKELATPNAAAIVMNPKTGEIYGMYSYPTFNPNSYTNLTEQLGKEVWDRLSGEEQSKRLFASWKNFNTQNPYEPGSTFKPLVLSMALEENLIDVNKLYYCSGTKVIADRQIRCWKREGHGTQTLQQALGNSCNPAIMEISESIPAETFYDYMVDFGIGELTHVDLPGEEKGIIHPLNKLGPVQKATSAMGQTFTTTTLQLLTGFSAVINGGYLMQPYVVSQVIDAGGNVIQEQLPVVKRQVISSSVSKQINSYLEYAVNSGTGSHASIDGYRIGGKTGTAEKQPREAGDYILSFIGFAPVEDPEVVCLVLFDEIPEGTGAPARAFKDIMKNVIPYLGITSDTAYETPAVDLGVVPDVKNVDLYSAIERLQTEQLSYEIIGVGTKITDQYPTPGVKLPHGGTVKIYTQTDAPDQVMSVPDVTGLTVSEAKTVLQDQFAVEVQGNSGGTIKVQIPVAGSKIEKGKKIIVQTVE